MLIVYDKKGGFVIPKELTNNRQLVVNILATAMALVLNVGVNFFLSPYIVRTIGAEANGFVQLSANIISFAALTAIALNSMAGRFVSVAVHQNDFNKAKEYYSAVFYGNCAIAAVLSVVAFICVIFLDRFINISDNLVFDVQILFAIAFANYLLNILFYFKGVAYFVKNKVHLGRIAMMLSQIVHVIILVSLFSLFTPKVYFVGIAAISASVFGIVMRVYFKRKLLPEINVKKQYYSRRTLFELLSSGVWNLVNSGGMILLNGLNLLIANILISPAGMGALALANTIPSFMAGLALAFTSAFTPQSTIHYANGDMVTLKKELKRSMKLTCILLTIPLACIITLGYEFFSLWVPSENAVLLHRLSVISCLGFIYISGVQCVDRVFIITNKLRTNSLLILLSGFLNVGVVYILLHVDSLQEYGLFIIVSVGVVINFLRNIFYVVPFAAKLLGYKWTTFFPEMFLSVLCSTIMIAISFGFKQLFIIDSWLKLFVVVGLIALVGLGVNSIIVLNKDERAYVKELIFKELNKLRRQGKYQD